MTFKEYIKEDRSKCEFLLSRKKWWRVKLLHEHEYSIWKYQKLNIHLALNANKVDMVISKTVKKVPSPFKNNKILSSFYRRKKNKLGEKLGFTIHKFVFGEGLRIWHYGNIVVNAHARIGKNCTLHGDNCIGNNGTSSKAPIIGDNVDIGVGAKIIGNITIANNVIIGAGAIVNKSITEENVVVAGIPAKIIKKISRK